MKNRAIRLICIFLTVSLLAAFGCGDGKAGKVLAVVSEEKITQSEVEEMVQSMAKKYISYGVTEEEFYGNEESRKALYDGVMEALIDQKLVLCLAEELGMEPLSEDERNALIQEGTAELKAMELAAEEKDDVTLTELLEFFGCTEDNYVGNYVSSKEYNIAFEFLSNLATVTDEDIEAYYNRVLEQQKTSAEETPRYLGNYAEEGTILYYPKNAVYTEYIKLDENCPDTEDYDAILEFYGEKASTDTAVVFPGTKQFSEENTEKIVWLKPGECSGVLEEGNFRYVFRCLENPKIPESWKELPETLMKSLKGTIGSEYVEQLLQKAREDGKVEYK